MRISRKVNAMLCAAAMVGFARAGLANSTDTWTGAAGDAGTPYNAGTALWNTTAANWSDTNGSNTFTPGDNVIFTDNFTTGDTTIAPTGTLNPAVMEFAHISGSVADTYTFLVTNGSATASSPFGGPVAGGALAPPQLVVDPGFLGRVVLDGRVNSGNTFRGATTINSGVVELDDAGALPGFTSNSNPTINLNGGVLAINITTGGNTVPASSQLIGTLNVTANSGIELDTVLPTGGSRTYNGNVNFFNNSTLNFNSVSGFEMDFAPLYYAGTGTLSLGSTSTALRLDTSSITDNLIAYDLGTGAGTLRNNMGNNGTEILGALTGGVNTALEGNEGSANTTTYLIGGLASSTFDGVVRNNTTGGPLAINKGGLASTTLTLSNGSNSYTAGTTVSLGGLASTATGGTPFGSGNITLNGGNLIVAPNGSGSAVAISAANGGPTNQVIYAGAGLISLNAGAESSLSLTVGDPTGTPGTAVLARTNQGTLIIAPASGTAGLGTTESLIVNPTTTGLLPALNNGIVNTTIVGQNNNAGKSGDFLTYGANGFALATYTDTNFAAASNTAVEQVNTPAVALASTNVFALKANANVDIGPLATLTVGSSASTQAGVILNGSSITSTAGTGILAFGSNEGTIYTSAAGGSISASISGTGGVTFFGPGVISLGASNSYTGTTAINGGTLHLNAGNNLGGTTSIQLNGGTLQFAAGDTADVTSINTGTATSLAINAGGGTLDLGGNTITFANPISGSNVATVLTIENGTLITTATNGFSATAMIASNGALQLGAGGTLGAIASGPIFNGGSLTVNRADNVTLANAIYGTGSLVLAGAGTVALSGTNTYSGITTVNAGASLYIGGGAIGGGKTGQVLGAIVDNGTVALNRSDLILVQNGAITGSGSLYNVGNGTVALTADSSYGGGTFINAGSLILGQDTTTGSVVGPIVDNANLTLDRSDTLYTFNNVISGTGSFTDLSTGTVVFASSNSYSGTTTVQLGTLRLGNARALGGINGTSTTAGNLTVNTALLDLNGNSINVTNLAGSGGTIDNLTAGGSVNVITASSANSTFASILRDTTGSVGLIQNGTGTLLLSGSNTNVGGLTINSGAIRLGKNSAVGASSNPLVNNSLLDLNGFSPTVGNLSGTGVIDNVSQTTTTVMTFTAGGSGTSTFGGVIQNTIETVNFAKGGSGTLALTGSNTYSGTTGVNSGNLVIATASALPANSALVLGNGTAVAQMTLSSSTGPFTLASITANTNGALNVTNNKLVINYASPAVDPVTAIAAALTSGHNGGSWTGSGINSSLAAASGGKFAVGYIDGDTPSDINGADVAANQIIIKYTLAGDAFLENSVGFDDLIRVAQNFGKTGEDWAGGNFNYDPTGSVGFADLISVAQNFGATSGISQGSGASGLSAAWQVATLQSTAVNPEPASAALAMVGAAGLLARRKRRR